MPGFYFIIAGFDCIRFAAGENTVTVLAYDTCVQILDRIYISNANTAYDAVQLCNLGIGEAGYPIKTFFLLQNGSLTLRLLVACVNRYVQQRLVCARGEKFCVRMQNSA